MAMVLVLAVLLVMLIYLVMQYNGLVSLRESVKQAWANIDVLLQQRHDELPKLVQTCRQYMQYERDTLEKVMLARAAVNAAHERHDMAALGSAENELHATLGRLYAVAENYPQLKADQSFQQLQARITGLESAIADRREYYNSQVQLNNTRIAQFPAVLLAHQFGFLPAQLLKIDQQERQDVDVGALFRAS
jgi:LemA protein